MTVFSPLLTLGTSLRSNAPETITQHILSGYAHSAEATATLAHQAQIACEAKALRSAFHAAIATPHDRHKVEILQQATARTGELAMTELGP